MLSILPTTIGGIMTWLEFLTIATTASATLAAALGVRIAFIEIRDDTDNFINDLHRQGRWQKLAAFVNLLAVALLIASQSLALLATP